MLVILKSAAPPSDVNQVVGRFNNLRSLDCPEVNLIESSNRRGTMFRYELGLLYNPQVSNETARDSLMTMIKGSKTLLNKLLATGFKVESGGKLTPRQVRIIMEHLGEP